MPRRTSRGIVWFLRPCESLNTARSEEHTSELQSRSDLVCRLLLEKKNEEVHHVELQVIIPIHYQTTALEVYRYSLTPLHNRCRDMRADSLTAQHRCSVNHSYLPPV